MALAVNAWGEAEEKYGPPGTAGGAGRPESGFLLRNLI